MHMWIFFCNFARKIENQNKNNMRKNLLYYTNVVLGALSFGLLGCTAQRPIEAKYGPPEPIDLYGIPVDEVINAEPDEISHEEPADTTSAPLKEEKK